MDGHEGGSRGVSARPLAWLLVVQILLGAVLLAWGLAGFPLPSMFGGPDAGRTEPAKATVASVTPTAAVRDQSAVLPRPTRDDFDARRAFALLTRQVEEYGPRPAGSAASRHLATALRRVLPNGRFEAIPGHPRLRNVVGHLPGRTPAVVLGAHYDTEATVPGHVGANDGAAGTAAVVEMARSLAKRRPRGGPQPREIRFVLFDGEEEPDGSTDFLRDGLRGSRAYVERHGDDVGRMVLVDYIAERAAPRYVRESGSDAALWGRLRDAARAVGVGGLFPDEEVGSEILDDHTPFALVGIPAIDVIDFDYPQRDSPQDNLDAVSQASLDASGEAVLALVRQLRR